MANPDHVAKIKEGVGVWNKWRKENPEIIPDLNWASLSRKNLGGANLERAILINATLTGADLRRANLKGAYLIRADLRGANLLRANLKGAEFNNAHLEGACLLECNLGGAEFGWAFLQNADFSRAIVDGETMIWGCRIDKKTKCEGVGLGNIRINPKERQLLEYNIRRMNWEQWYKYKDWDTGWPKKKRNCVIRSLMFFIQLFWWMSDYGRSTKRIIWTFVVMSLSFAMVYYFAAGLINDLHGTGTWYSDLVRACYFSVVTMTTLGFGDMYANKGSMAGHLLLIFQVILGYVLLGALITRFAVLFQAGGPTGDFEPMDEETKELLAEMKSKNGSG